MSIYRPGPRSFTLTKESPPLAISTGFTLILGRAPSKNTGKIPLHSFDDIAQGLRDTAAKESGKRYYWELQPFTRLDAVRIMLLQDLEKLCPPGSIVWSNSSDHEMKTLVDSIRPFAEVIIE